jgi:hypothetical protein
MEEVAVVIAGVGRRWLPPVRSREEEVIALPLYKAKKRRWRERPTRGGREEGK